MSLSLAPMRLAAMLTLSIVAAAPAASAGEDDASGRPPGVTLREWRSPHRFLDNANAALTGLEIASLMADAMSTRRALDMYPGVAVEADPLARPFVALGWSGQILGGALFVGAELLGRNALHRNGHHRLERMLPLVLSALEAGVAVHNLQSLRELERMPAGQ